MLELAVSGQHSLPSKKTPLASTPYVGRHRSDRSAPSGRPRRECAPCSRALALMLIRQSVHDALPRENSDMTDNLTDDEVERARRAGEAFGRQIGGRAIDEGRRVALTLAEVNTQQAQLKSIGPRASRAIDVGAMSKRQDGMRQEAATAWADGGAAGFEAAMSEAVGTPEDSTNADRSRATAGLHEAGYAHGWATAQNTVELIQSARSEEEINQALRETKRALIVGLRDYAIDHDAADVEAWSWAALAAYEDGMKHLRLVVGRCGQ